MGVCFHIEGVRCGNCRHLFDLPAPVSPLGPFKCPDCGTWWVGLEHRCRSAPPLRDRITADGTQGMHRGVS